MSTFILTIDLDGHTHEHSPRAHRHLIGQMLANATSAVGSSEATQGDLLYPPGSGKVIGSWKLLSARPTDAPRFRRQAAAS